MKWFGRAFGELAIAGQLGPALDAAVAAETLPDREAALVVAYELAMRATNALGLAAAMEPTVRPFFERGFLVTMGERFAGALYSAISDPAVLALPPRLGAVDQYIDSTDVLAYPDMLRRVAR